MKNITQEMTCNCKDLPYGELEMSLTYLMSRFALKPSQHIAHAVLHHLEKLVENTDKSLSDDKRKHYAKLYNFWWSKITNEKSTDQNSLIMTEYDDETVRH